MKLLLVMGLVGCIGGEDSPGQDAGPPEWEVCMDTSTGCAGEDFQSCLGDAANDAARAACHEQGDDGWVRVCRVDGILRCVCVSETGRECELID